MSAFAVLRSLRNKALGALRQLEMALYSEDILQHFLQKNVKKWLKDSLTL
jgi:hypothetical protein